MNISISQEKLKNYLESQLNSFFPDAEKLNNLTNVIVDTLVKLENNFKYVALKHYYKNNEIYFNHLNADQYTIFIYYASNIAYEIYNDEILATKLFYLNKILHQFHCMYNTKLPDIFVLIHGTGIVLGKAKYSNYLVLSQHCNIGANEKLEYPEISEFTIFYPNSSLIGKSIINKKCCISNGTFINNEIVGPEKLIIGRSPNLIIKNDLKNRFDYFFKIGSINDSK